MRREEITKLRKGLHMTQEQFAERIGISRPHLARIESGNGVITENLILKIDSIFNRKETESRFLIPYYDIEATATPMEIFEGENSIPHINLDLPGFAGCDFAINIAGHSMYPSIEAGSMILCKKINDKSIIMYGEVYLIVTEDYRMVKRIKKSPKKGHLILASDNHNGHNAAEGQTYAPFEIPIDKIIHLYLVKGSIRRVHI